MTRRPTYQRCTEALESLRVVPGVQPLPANVVLRASHTPVQVPMYSASGLRVLYLKVWEKGDYKVDKWVRKVARSGSYEIRA